MILFVYHPHIQLPDDAVVQGGPEEGPAHFDFILGSDSDILISLGAKPHQPLNATFPQRVFTRIGGLDREGNESTVSNVHGFNVVSV